LASPFPGMEGRRRKRKLGPLENRGTHILGAELPGPRIGPMIGLCWHGALAAGGMEKTK
jgi:hypothetical protein